MPRNFIFLIIVNYNPEIEWKQTNVVLTAGVINIQYKQNGDNKPHAINNLAPLHLVLIGYKNKKKTLSPLIISLIITLNAVCNYFKETIQQRKTPRLCRFFAFTATKTQTIFNFQSGWWSNLQKWMSALEKSITTSLYTSEVITIQYCSIENKGARWKRRREPSSAFFAFIVARASDTVIFTCVCVCKWEGNTYKYGGKHKAACFRRADYDGVGELLCLFVALLWADKCPPGIYRSLEYKRIFCV